MDPHSKIGRVVSVAGSQVIVLIEPSLSPTGQGSGETLQMGELVKMESPSHFIFGMVGGMTIPMPSRDQGDDEMKVVELEMLGEVRKGETVFKRGVSDFPSLGDPVYRTAHEDLVAVYARPADSTVEIGTIHQDRDLPALIATDDLLGKHFAILGTTGSGKSCAVALILHKVLYEHPFGHVLLLDPHNEYSSAFGEAAEVLSPGSLKLPYWLFNFEELVQVILGDEAKERGTEVAILNEAIPAAKRQFLGDKDDARFVTVDTPVPYQISDLIQVIDDAMGKLDNPENSAPYMRLKARLNSLRRDSRFAFMFGGISVRDNMTEILARIFRVPVDGRPITIMDLSGIPSEILNVVVSVLCRMTFDLALWSQQSLPVMLVCEEAHRYAPKDTSLGFEPTKRALARIAKEGRKYGASLCLVSQRPSELATDILSQCNTIFALRMGNQNDQDFVRATLWESARGLMDYLPSLRNAEAIAVGEGVPIPVRVCFEQLPPERQPRSGTAPFSSAWRDEGENTEFLEETVRRWRRQIR